MLRRLIEGVVVDEDRPKDAALRLKIVRERALDGGRGIRL